MSKRTLLLVIIFCVVVVMAIAGVLWLTLHKTSDNVIQDNSSASSSCTVPKNVEPGTTVIKAQDGTCVTVPPGSPPKSTK